MEFWEIDNFVIESDIFRGFFNFKTILNKIIVLPCSENIVLLPARRGILKMHVFLVCNYNDNDVSE
jgi:hypothetical protein